MSLNATRFHYQIHYAIESMLMYIYAVSSNKIVSKAYAKSLSEKGIKLLELLEKEKIELAAAEERLNGIVEELNSKLPAVPLFSAYPTFYLSNEPIQVTYQIIAFQQFLNQELRNGKVNLKDETPIFDETVQLWRKALTPRIPPKEAMRELSQLIRRGNDLLPQELQYPIPDPTYYTTKL